ncbi:polysaccharide biosynthesis/export family protein [soil metagenome]
MRLRWVCCALALFVSACAGRVAGPVVESGERYVLQNSPVEDYLLGAGDKVKMTVFNEEALSGEFGVNAEGSLSLPLIGDVPVLGKSVSSVAQTIQAKLANGYLRDPRVSMEIITYRPFFILGEIKLPGQYPYASGMTVMNAIAVAQGYTPRAHQSIIYIRKLGATEEVPYRLTPDLRVWPGDTIRIGERYF